MMQRFQYNLIDMLCLQWTAIASDNNDKQMYKTYIHLTKCNRMWCATTKIAFLGNTVSGILCKSAGIGKKKEWKYL